MSDQPILIADWRGPARSQNRVNGRQPPASAKTEYSRPAKVRRTASAPAPVMAAAAAAVTGRSSSAPESTPPCVGTTCQCDRCWTWSSDDDAGTESAPAGRASVEDAAISSIEPGSPAGDDLADIDVEPAENPPSYDDTSTAPPTLASGGPRARPADCRAARPTAPTAEQGPAINNTIASGLRDYMKTFQRGSRLTSDFKAKALRNAISAIAGCATPLDEMTQDEMMELPSVGKETVQKIFEIIHTGGPLGRLQAAAGDPEQAAISLLSSVWGIGRLHADQFYRQGVRHPFFPIFFWAALLTLFWDQFSRISQLYPRPTRTVRCVRLCFHAGRVLIGARDPTVLPHFGGPLQVVSLADLRARTDLNDMQRIGIESYDDIKLYMQRAEVEAIGGVVCAAAATINAGIECVLGGSYRRGEPTSGDVDVMFFNDDDATLAAQLSELIRALTRGGFITADSHCHAHNGVRGKDPEASPRNKFMGLCGTPSLLITR